MQPNPIYVRDKIREFINEEIGELGIKYPENFFRNFINASFVACEDLVVCGVQWVPLFFENLTSATAYKIIKIEKEGLFVPQGSTIALFKISPAIIVALENAIINFLSHLCGVATSTRKLLRRVDGLDIEIVDTPATTPGLKVFEKYALALGGVKNDLLKSFDSVVVSTNDIYLFGSVGCAIDFQLNSATGMRGIEVHIENPSQLEQALEDRRVNCIGFIGLNVEDLHSAIRVVKTIRPDIKIKTFGRTVFHTREVVKTGIDAISLSDLVARSRPIKIKMRISKS